MTKQECDKYTPKLKNYRDKTCVHFIGDINIKYQVERCSLHCDVYGKKSRK